MNLAFKRPKTLFVTDDYSPEEIAQKIHFKHFKRDIEIAKVWNSDYVYIYTLPDYSMYQLVKVSDL